MPDSLLLYTMGKSVQIITYALTFQLSPTWLSQHSILYCGAATKYVRSMIVNHTHGIYKLYSTRLNFSLSAPLIMQFESLNAIEYTLARTHTQRLNRRVQEPRGRSPSGNESHWVIENHTIPNSPFLH